MWFEETAWGLMTLCSLACLCSFMSMMKMFGGAHGSLGEDTLWRLYEAQTLWDEVRRPDDFQSFLSTE